MQHESFILPGELFLVVDRVVPDLEQQWVLKQCGVYAWFRGSFCLYVGSTGHLGRRLLGLHHVINEKEVVLPDDKFLLFIGRGQELEEELITALQPELNQKRTFPHKKLDERYREAIKSRFSVKKVLR